MKAQLATSIPQPRIPIDIAPAAITGLGDALELVKVRIADLDLTASVHTGVVFEQALLQKVLLTRSRLNGARLFDVRCDASDLSGATWQRSRWQRAYVKGCKLTGMQLSSFSGVDLLFHECTMEGMIVGGGKVKGVHFEKCRMARTVFDRVEMNDVTFRGCDCTGMDLSGSQLRGVDLRGSDVPDIRIETGQYKGLTIDHMQAVELMAQLGCIVSGVDAE
jgi:uncharacterized protein YjbI with pentapeptide repeats